MCDVLEHEVSKLSAAPKSIVTAAVPETFATLSFSSHWLGTD